MLSSEPTKISSRLLSIDALRGFDMFFIAGGGAFIYRLADATDAGWVDGLAHQLEHPAWNGFTFYDFIFPLFLFISGVSVSFSVGRKWEKGTDKRDLYRKAFKRMVILILLGILYKNAPVPLFDPAEIRLGSVLGRIGFATFITTVLYLNFTRINRLLWVAGILIVYYALLFLVPVPGYGAGDLSFEGNLVGWFDRTFLPGRLLQGTYDELGLLTQFPALCLTVLGSWAGDLLRMTDKSDRQKLMQLSTIGIILISIGLLWNLHFPINKHLWTSSFICLTGGMGFLIMALFYGIIDVLQYRKWAFFFKVIGMNSLVIYFAYSFVDWNYTAKKLLGGLLAPLDETWQAVFVALGALGLVWTMLYILYRNKIFVKF